MSDLNLPLVLGEFLAKSALVIALGFAILTAVRKFFPAAAKHSLWLRVFGASLAIPVLLVAFPRWEIVPDFFAEPVVEKTPAVSGSYETATVAFTPAAPVEKSVAVSQPVPSAFKISWPWVLFAIWSGGVVFLFIRSLLAAAYLRQIERSSSLAGDPILAIFNQLKGSSERETTLLISPSVKSPFTWGLTHPRIVLPESVSNWSSSDLEMVLLHELEHVRRRDAFSVFVSRIFLALNWTNPLAWLANSQAVRLREEACDVSVLSAGHTSESYAELLFRQAKSSANPFLQTCATAVAESGTIEQRIKMILNPKSKSQFVPENFQPFLFHLIPFFVVGCILAIGLVGCEKTDQAASDPDLTASSSTEALSTIELFVDGKVVTIEEVKTLLEDDNDLSVGVLTSEKSPEAEFEVALEKLGDLGVRNVALLVSGDTSTSPQLALMNKKLDGIIIPSIELIETPLRDAVAFLQSRSIELDTFETEPDKKGINIIVGSGKLSDATLTVSLTNIPLREALKIFAQLSGGEIKVDEYAVTIGNKKNEAGSATLSADDKKRIEANTQKLKSIMLPSLEFHETPFRDAIAYLQQRSVELDTQETDPGRKGINIVLDSSVTEVPDDGGGGFDAGAGEVPLSDTRTNLTLKNIPLSEALRYTCELAGMEYHVRPYHILITQKSAKPKPKTAKAKGTTTTSKAALDSIDQKLRKITLQSVEFKDVGVRDALEFIQLKSVELDTSESDTGKKGINIILNSGVRKDTRVTLKLTNVPLIEAIRYTANLAQLTYEVTPHAVVFSPKEERNNDLLYTHVYTIQKEIFDAVTPQNSLQKILEAEGVSFEAEGASMTANPAQRKIVMRNTLPEFEDLERFLDTVISGTSWSTDRK